MKTNNSNKTNRTAPEAYEQHLDNIAKLMAGLTRKMKNTDQDFRCGKSVDWADVGDVAETEKVLQDLYDRLFEKGEYAPEQPKTYSAFNSEGKAIKVTIPSR